MLTGPSPVASDSSGTKSDHNEIKNLLDLYKISSEETRHSATTFWQYAVAILVFQATAVGIAVNSRSTPAILAIIPAAGISFLLSLMLIRQAHDRQLFVRRVKSIEDILQKLYCDVKFDRVTGPFDGFKSGDLAWLIMLWSVVLLLSAAFWLAIRLICPDRF